MSTGSANQSSDSLINKSSSIVTAADTGVAASLNVNLNNRRPTVCVVYMSGATQPTTTILLPSTFAASASSRSSGAIRLCSMFVSSEHDVTCRPVVWSSSLSSTKSSSGGRRQMNSSGLIFVWTKQTGSRQRQ